MLRTRGQPPGEQTLPFVRNGKTVRDGGAEDVPTLKTIFTLVVFEPGLRCIRQIEDDSGEFDRLSPYIADAHSLVFHQPVFNFLRRATGKRQRFSLANCDKPVPVARGGAVGWHCNTFVAKQQLSIPG